MYGPDTSIFAYGLWPMVYSNMLLFALFAVSFIRLRGGVEWWPTYSQPVPAFIPPPTQPNRENI